MKDSQKLLELANVQSRFKRGIFSLETALFLCDLTDRTPRRFHMVFPATYNLSGLKQEEIICSGSKEPLYSLGVVDLKTPGGNTVRGYCTCGGEACLFHRQKMNNASAATMINRRLLVYGCILKCI